MSDICTSPSTFVLTQKSNPQTNEEIEIERQFKTEISAVCNGLTANNTELTSNSTVTTDSSDYSNKQSERESVVQEIRTKTQEYNLQIIKIKSAESAVQMKLLQFNHAEQALTDAKRRLEEIKNNIEVLDEKINSNI